MKVNFEDLMGVKAAAALLGIPAPTIKAMIRRGEISPTAVIGGATVIPAEALKGVKANPKGRPRKVSK